MNMIFRNYANDYDDDFPFWPDLFKNFWRLGKYNDFCYDKHCGSRMTVNTDDKNVTVKLPCPGLKKEDMEIEVVGDFVTIRVKRTPEEPAEGSRKLIGECKWGQFEESVEVPVPIDDAKASAKYVDGILEITIPRLEEVKPQSRMIKVE